MEENNLLVNFGIKLKYWRLKRKLTQEELAEKLLVAPHYISDIERGRRNITMQTINRLAAALDIEVHRLFNFAD